MNNPKIDPNADNGVNPLDTLDFDINTLIPQKEFNWETVEGIDSIHNSVMKAYGNVASDFSKRIDKIEGKVASYDCAITDSLGRCVDNLATNVDTIDSGIADSLCLATDGLCETYGNGIAANQWWIVYRQCEDGLYHPFLESISSYPVGYEAYGPFKDCSVFRIDLPKTLAVLPSKQSSSPSADPDMINRVNGLYQEQLSLLQNVYYPGYQEGQGEDDLGGCGPLSSCPLKVEAPTSDCKPQRNGVIMPGRAGCYETWYPDTCLEVNVIAKDADGTPFYKVVNDDQIFYQPWIKKEVCTNEIYPIVGIPVPIEQPNQNGSPGTIQIPEQQTLPINPPNSSVPVTPISNGPNTGSNISSCPAPIIQNVVNVAPCEQSQSPGGSTTVTVEATDFAKLIGVIQDCCSKLGKQSESSSKGIASDIEYSYSESGQERIDTFLQSNGLDRMEKLLPDTIGDAMNQLLDKLNGDY
jgi:hypothetical protein